jgi:PAS domain S-box-containing protein
MKKRLSFLVATGFASLLALGLLTSLAMVFGIQQTVTRAQESQQSALSVRASVRSLRADYLESSDVIAVLLLGARPADPERALRAARANADKHIAAADEATDLPELRTVLGRLREHTRRETHPLEDELVRLAGHDLDRARAQYVARYLPTRARDLMLAERALRIATLEVAAVNLRVDEKATEMQAIAWLALGLFLVIGTAAGLALSRAVRVIALNFERSASRIAQQRDDLRAIMDAMTDAVVVVDEEGSVRGANRAATTLLGYDEDELVGRPLRSWARDSATGQPVVPEDDAAAAGYNVDYLARDGTAIPTEVSIARLQEPDGTPLGRVWVARDLRDRLRLLAEMQAARDAALENSRLKSEFLANVSHEIRTPMHAIIGYTEMALEGTLDPQPREWLTGVQRSAVSLLALINDILDLSKIEAGKLTLERVAFDVRELLDEVVRMLGVQAEAKAIGLTTSVDRGVPVRAIGDPTRLRQVLVNLVGNAIKFTDRGAVSVQVAVESAGEGGALVHWTVVDTGIGIAADKRASIFSAFSQADGSMARRYGGTGLGLTIAARVVELMGGRIWLESEPGKGSVFHFTVRLKDADHLAA